MESASTGEVPVSRHPPWPVRWSLGHPRLVLSLFGLATLLALPGLFRLELRTDGAALAPPDDPAIRIDREIRRHFDLRDPLVVLLESRRAEGVWNPGTLARLRDLTAALSAVPGVDAGHAASLALQKGFSYDVEKREFRTLLDPLPRTPAEIAELKADVERLDLPVGLLVSAGGEAATVLLGVPALETGETVDRYALWRRVDAVAQRFADRDHTVRVVGAPATEALLGHHILEDLGFLLPAALGLLALILLLATRRLAATAAGLVKIGVCITGLFGFMGWMGAPVYLTTAVLPVILVTVGLADEIHLLFRFRELAAAGASRPEAVERTFDELGRAVLLTSLTAGFGFLSFVTSPIAPIASFGLFAAAGVFYCLLYSFCATPALLSLLPAAWLVARVEPEPRHLAPWQERLAGFVGRRPLAVLGAAGLGLAVAAAGIPRLAVQDSWLDGFSRKSELSRATGRVNELFHGTHRLLAVVRFDPALSRLRPGRIHSGPLVDPETLARVGELEALLAADPRVGGVVGPHRLLATASGIAAGGDARFRRIRDDADGNGLLWAYLERGLGKAGRRQAVDDAFERGVVTIYLKHANYRDTAAILARIEAFSRTRLAPLGGRVEFAGDVAVSQAMIPAIVRGQVGSILGSLLSAGVVIALLLRSLSRGLLAVAPAAAAVAFLFGVMGWTGLPLGVATSMFCAITLGIGVDYAIHLLERHRLAAQAGDPEPARRALAAAAPAIVWDTLAIALGFGLLAVSQVPANRRLGLLVAAALALACLLTLFGLGAWLGLRSLPAPALATTPPAPLPRERLDLLSVKGGTP